jgi:uncharacterized membrane protein
MPEKLLTMEVFKADGGGIDYRIEFHEKSNYGIEMGLMGATIACLIKQMKLLGASNGVTPEQMSEILKFTNNQGIK